jgi:hypothetical protein
MQGAPDALGDARRLMASLLLQEEVGTSLSTAAHAAARQRRTRRVCARRVRMRRVTLL